MTDRELIETVLRRSAADPVFRATALHDPVAAIAQIADENDITINAKRAEAIHFVPPGVEVEPGTTTFVLPDPIPEDELDDALLDQVAGGCFYESYKIPDEDDPVLTIIPTP